MLAGTVVNINELEKREFVGKCDVLIVDTQAHADAAARIVDAVYEPHGKPIVTLHEAINAQSFSPQDGTEAFKKGEPYGKELHDLFHY